MARLLIRALAVFALKLQADPSGDFFLNEWAGEAFEAERYKKAELLSVHPETTSSKEFY